VNSLCLPTTYHLPTFDSPYRLSRHFLHPPSKNFCPEGRRSI
jgi:hypothetical protein